MIPINIDHLQFECKKIKMSLSFNGRKPETVIRSFSFVSYFYFHYLQYGLHRLLLDIKRLETLLGKCVKTQAYRANSAIAV